MKGHNFHHFIFIFRGIILLQTCNLMTTFLCCLATWLNWLEHCTGITELGQGLNPIKPELFSSFLFPTALISFVFNSVYLFCIQYLSKYSTAYALTSVKALANLPYQ